MNWFKTISSSAAKREYFLLLISLVIISGLFSHHNFLWRWDNLLYDAQLSFWSRTVADDIVIIAIDDESLNDLGRWPWPRSTHAKLIRKLELESPRVIGLDIIFAESDVNDSSSDVLLAQAMQASGKVVLPLFMMQESVNSYPIESLPLPEFVNSAVALGHVHIDIGKDGIARKVFLKEGIGEPQWLHYSIAMLSVVSDVPQAFNYLNAVQESSQYSSLQWSREYPFLIPFAGPPGHFQQIGYSQVMSGEYKKDLFRDKIVLVGTTAEGLGDVLPTPLSGNSGSMPGVEIIANVLDAVRNDIRITALQAPWLIIVTMVLVALPLLIYPRLNPAHALWVLFAAVISTIIAVVVSLLLFGLWIPIATALLFQFIAYPLWSWRRLEMSMRHINMELNQFSDMQKSLSIHQQRNISDEIEFVSQFISIDGWMLQDKDGAQISQGGVVPVCNISQLKSGGWSNVGNQYWTYTFYNNMSCRLGLSLSADAVVTDDVMRLLNSLVKISVTDDSSRSRYVEDVLQERIQQVQVASNEYTELRRIVDDSLSGMANGVLICSSRGQVMLSNRRAGWYLLGDDTVSLNGKPLNKLLQNLRLVDGDNWKSLLQQILYRQKRVLAQAQDNAGRDLMIEISPLRIIGNVFDGFVMTFSDISLLKVSERKRNEVLSFLSHDLRSPLASIVAMIELAKNKVNVDEVRTLLIGMENNTQKTLHLAEQFLQLSRATTSERIKFYDIDFNSVVLNAVDQIWALSNKMNIKIKQEFADDELWINAEPDLLERAVVNLLSNAIKHSDAGSTVTVSVMLNKNEITCCVSDTGTGISAEELPHLFEMFMRTKSVGLERKQGIGLGLAFVDAVAKRHSGYVDVESTQREGSSFCLKFPKTDLQD